LKINDHFSEKVTIIGYERKNKCTTHKEKQTMNTSATASPAIDRKAIQAAIKNINSVLAPTPKLGIIGTTEFLTNQVVSAIGACIGQDEAGSPIWTNPAAANLDPGTITTYEALVAAAAAEPAAAEPAAAEADEAAAAAGAVAEPAAAATGEIEGECAAWAAKAGPKAGDAECDACPDLKECADRAAPAAGKSGTKKSAEEKAAEKAAKAAAKAAEKAAKAAEKAAKPKKDEYNGVNAMVEVLLANQGKAVKRVDLIAQADVIYKQHGATGEIKQDFATAIRTLFKALPLLGLGSMEEGVFTYTGK
jgi:hypothetical protein